MMSFNPTHTYDRNNSKIAIDKSAQKILLKPVNGPEKIFDFGDVIEWKISRKIGSESATDKANYIILTMNDLDEPLWPIRNTDAYDRDVWYARITAALKGR
jgi:hypothetical protein